MLLRAAGSPMSLVGEWGALQELLDLCCYCCCYHVPFLVGIVEISASLRARRLNFCVFVSIRAHPWEVEAPLYFFLKNRIFQTFLTKNLHFALFICQYGFFFVPLHAFYGVLVFAP